MTRKRIVRETGTFARHMGGGFVRTVDGAAWLYMRMPDQPSVTDASGMEERLKAARPMLSILGGLADRTPRVPFAGRKAMKGLYRRVHILAVSGSRPFEPSPTLDPDNRLRLAAEQEGLAVRDRFTLFGVRLNTGGGQGGVKGFLKGVADEDGWTPDDAFEHDLEDVRALMEDAGCRVPSDTTMRRAMAFWPTDRKPEGLPVMVEHDHMHTFPDYRSAFVAARMREKVDDCRKWSARIPGSYPLTVVALGALPFKGENNTAPGSDWAAGLLDASRCGAVAISVKGLVEPGEMTREQLDKDADKVLDKAYAQAAGGRKANLGVARDLEAANGEYQADGKPWPTLVQAHAHAALPMIVEQSNRVPYPGLIGLNPDRQEAAFEDMQIGSDGMIEYNPSPLYWPAPILAFSGLAGCSMTGDDSGRGLDSDLPGAFVGVTEADGQPVYDSPFAASRRSGKAISIIVGSTGSGKAVSLGTPLPVPPQKRFPEGGLVPLRDLEDGDMLYARDGKTYPILGMSPIGDDDMYEIVLSDGQRIKASGDHQWCAWTWRDRNFARTGKHRKSLERRERVRKAQERLRAMAAGHGMDEWWDCERIWREVRTLVAPFAGKGGETWVRNALRFADVPSRMQPGRARNRPRGRFYEPAPLLGHIRDRWEHTVGNGFGAEARALRLARLDGLIADPPAEPIDTAWLLERFGDLGVSKSAFESALRSYDGPRAEPAETARRMRVAWPAPLALARLADRIGWRYRDEPGAGHGEQTVTTREMLDEGLLADGGQANWAIRATAPVQGVRTDLPIDPWVLGAWLADGSKTGGEFASDPSNGDLDHLENRLRTAGYEVTRSTYDPQKTYAKRLVRQLRANGFYGNKHIPEPYFHADVEQRLELVRGLLDQDGAIDQNGSVEFTQSIDHKPIVDGLIRLLRSLGVVVHEATRTKAGYTADGERHETRDRLRLTFTTSLPVFSLPRKRMLLPTELRETSKWLYVKGIRPIADCPHRCLSIASPDRTYLIGGYVPTHNTRLGLHVAAQWGRLPDPEHPGMQIPVVFWDPKPKSSDFEPFVRKRGGVVVKLDRPEARGILDPLRCIPRHMTDTIVQTSVAMLSQITGGANPDRAWEMGVSSIVGYGLRHGADCLGECVRLAWEEYSHKGREAKDIDPLVERIRPVLDRAVKNDPLMPLIYGTEPGGRRLSLSQGMTLISAGSLNVITDKEIQGAPTDVQRWVCRMAALGASCLVIGRNGAVVIDEAWSLLQDRFGRSVVNRMGRLARDQHYMVMMLSQKADEFVDAGIEDFIGKVYVLAVGARNEGAGRDSQAQAACRLANQPLDGRMHARMMHDKYVDPDSRAPDWESLYPLRDPETGELRRGSVAYLQVGDAASAIPVVVRVDGSLD